MIQIHIVCGQVICEFVDRGEPFECLTKYVHINEKFDKLYTKNNQLMSKEYMIDTYIILSIDRKID